MSKYTRAITWKKKQEKNTVPYCKAVYWSVHLIALTEYIFLFRSRKFCQGGIQSLDNLFGGLLSHHILQRGGPGPYQYSNEATIGVSLMGR